MSARTAVGAAAQPRAVASACELHLAKQAPARTTRAFACKPEQPAHVGRWLVATAGMARTVRWPIPEVKARTAPASAARGSRASTDPKNPPDLLNPSKGLSMAKTAPVSLKIAPKFVPVAHSLQSAQRTQTRTCETVIARSYTLCEGHVYLGVLRFGRDLPYFRATPSC